MDPMVAWCSNAHLTPGPDPGHLRFMTGVLDISAGPVCSKATDPDTAGPQLSPVERLWPSTVLIFKDKRHTHKIMKSPWGKARNIFKTTYNVLTCLQMIEDFYFELIL